jgi:myo-inositol-hexaphosphate 3-phosphohydrolase/phosphodiesterase/alkaline phosphatase D-like protein
MDIRVATFNASLNRNSEGELIADLSTSADTQAQSVAEIIQRSDADIILMNEFDYEAAGEAARLFQENYLSLSQNGAAPVEYPHVYVAPSNTGVPSGFDLDNSGAAGDFAPNDAQGFGFFEGQYGFVIFSKYEIDTANIRTFQNFLWKDMPGALLPEDPLDADGNGDTSSWYTEEELEVLRLSSKNHVDVPVIVDGETVHVLAAHPTPPVYDGPEDRNGTRNHDEIRFWADYVAGEDYIYDDNGTYGGLAEGERFVILGDYNADPFDGDSVNGAANQLLDSPLINGSATDPAVTPSSDGGPVASELQGGANDDHVGDPAFDTADFGFAGAGTPDDAPGNLRVDYVLPSEAGLAYLDGGVFWQTPDDPLFPLAEFPTSDHRLVYADLRVTDDDRTTVTGVEFLGMTEIDTGVIFDGTIVGGLSGIVLDPATNTYLAVSDDRGAGADGTPRFYEVSIDLGDGSLDEGDVSLLGVTALTLPGGATFDALSPDPEGIAIGANGQLFISSERDLLGNPAIYLFGKDGVLGGALPVDTKFLPTPAGTNGVRNNLGFESLTISPDQTTLWTATESALVQDGAPATTELGSAARIIRYDLETGLPVAEFVYEVDQIANEPVPADAFADSGLVELLALDDQGTLLALERSFSTGAADRGYTGKLYLVDTRGATNVIGENGLPVSEDDGELEIDVDAPVKKTLLADLGDFGIVVDNVEGMTLGPVLDDGRQSLIIVSDDNFSAFGPQASQFISLALDLQDIPTIAPVLETPDELRYDSPFDTTEGPDPDDPAVWLNPKDAGASTIVTAMKNGGLRVYDIEGNELQRIEPEGIRYNNVDVLYGAGKGKNTYDLAVASDRENDTLAIYRFKKDGTLKDATSCKIPETIFGVDDGEATAYGLAAYTAPDGRDYVFVTQADGNKIAQLELKQKGKNFTFDLVRTLELPVADGEEAEDYQAEGIVIDRETGIGYVAVEEELGLLSFSADPDGPATFETVAPVDAAFFSPDIEGVSIYYGDDGDGLILVSSQGDSTFAVFDRINHSYLGSFAIGANNGIDGVEESDGAEIYSGSLPGFENGLLVTQDGSNEIQVVFPEPDDGEVQNWNVNFKLSDLGDVLALFGKATNPDFDPRELTPQTLPQGVSAGDVTEDSVVLWARSLALGEVEFKVYEAKPNGRLKKVAVQSVEVTDTDVPVKVLIDDLDPGKDYVFEVEDAAGATRTGRFGTAAEDGYNGLVFGVSGDWRGELAPYPAISNADEAELDFFVLHGDTIYSDYPSPALDQPQAITPEDYRTKYAEVYGARDGLNAFADLKASTAIFATIDDHEVTNDFAGGGTIGGTAESEFRDLFPGDDPAAFVNDATLYENGLTAFQEYHAVADKFYGDTGDALTAGERELYRFQEFGQDAAVFILDQRSFRDEPLAGANLTDPADIARFRAESFGLMPGTEGRSLLGAAQLDDLKADLLAAEENGVTWKFVHTPEPIQNLGFFNADSWEGYAEERTELLSFIEENDISNVVFVAADIHATFVNNLTYEAVPGTGQIASSAWEITTGAVAFDAPFGPSAVEVAGGLGILSPAELAYYDSLPVASDTDDLPDDKDDFVKQAFNSVMAQGGYDPIGLNDNLAQAEGLIDATLLSGDYVAAHTFGWTQFEIDADTQALTVTTWGIPAYTPEQAGSNTDLVPQIVSQFVVDPQADEAPEPSPTMLAAKDGYLAEAVFTIGETFSGTTGALNETTAGDYTPVGVLDGLGAFAHDVDGDGAADVVRLLANHELLNNRGNAYEVSDGNGGTFSMTGARISYFDFDIESRQIVDAGLAYDTIYDGNGDIASDQTFLSEAYAPFFGGPESASQWQGFSRFCSGMLVEAEQFGNNRGLVDTVYFAGEEDGGGYNSVGGAEWALDVETGALHQVPAMGRGAWENVTQIDTGDRKHVAFVLSDDTAPYDFDGDGEDEAAPLFLYVGEKDRHSDDFLARNGLADGKLYVWVAEAEELAPYEAIKAHIAQVLASDDLTRREERKLARADSFADRHEGDERLLEKLAERLDVDLTGDSIDSPLEFSGTGAEIAGRWVEINNEPRPGMASEDGTTGFDEYGYPTQGNLWLQAKEAGAFGFSRPEDVATNPDNGSEFVLASTGVDTYDIDPETGNGADSFGTVYTMEVEFGRKAALKSSTLKIAYDGDDDPARALRSPDNLDWARDGLIYVQEDKAEDDTLTGEPLFGTGAANPEEAGIVALDPDTGEVVRIANVDRGVVLDGSIADPGLAVDVDAGIAGAWESSGILEVSELFGIDDGSLFLATVQAHGIEDQAGFNAESRLTDADLVEGGQLLFFADEFLFA